MLTAHAPPNTMTRLDSPTSTRNISTTMAPIDEAVAGLKLCEEGEQFSLKEIADKYGVERSTLGRRWRGVTRSKEEGYASQQALSPQQEIELVGYIEKLPKKGLPPTREMIRTFLSEVTKRQLGKCWVDRFVKRNKIHLISKWTTRIDRNRHQADSETKYRLYFDLLHSKMREYDILPCHIYNMDEKGFLIRVTGRIKRVFTRRQWDKKEVRASLQDGSRKFLTVLVSMCADGSRLPAGLIYAGANGAIRSTWVEDIEVGQHDVFVSSSLTGWPNNEMGLA
jgi:transcriptional regulator with XRE-family HTH domain